MHQVDPVTGCQMERRRGIIERGEVVAASDGLYTIKSLDREGITLPPMAVIDERAYSVGDRVYFFYFADGSGRIICGF